MKHPIAYRIGMYVAIAVQSGILLYVLHAWSYAPFSSLDMRYSFFNGCNLGYHAPLTNESIARCSQLANDFKITLDDLDRQMNEKTSGH